MEFKEVLKDLIISSLNAFQSGIDSKEDVINSILNFMEENYSCKKGEVKNEKW